MIDHITLHVSNAERSIAFYTKALSPLGYIPKAHHEPTIGFGVDDGTPRSDFYISPMDDPAQQPIPTHIAFRATDEQADKSLSEANRRASAPAYHAHDIRCTTLVCNRAEKVGSFNIHHQRIAGS